MFNGFTRQITGYYRTPLIFSGQNPWFPSGFPLKKPPVIRPDLAGAESGNAPHPRPTATPEARDMAGLSGLQRLSTGWKTHRKMVV